MKIFAVSGYKGSGKTTLCLALLGRLKALGVRAAYIKRTAEDELLEASATDTGDVRRSGVPALLWGKHGVVLEADVAERIDARVLAAKFFPDAEIVLLEGGKMLPLPKIWVRGTEENTPDFPGIFLVYDRMNPGDGVKTFGAGDEKKLAGLLAGQVRGDAYRSAHVYIGDRPLPMKDFVADFVRGGIVGMLSALKGGDTRGLPVRIYLDEDGDGQTLSKND